METSDNPYKIGNKVHHNGVAGIVTNVNGLQVQVQRHFNCSRYWDHHSYWKPLTKDVKQIGGIAAIMEDQGNEASND